MKRIHTGIAISLVLPVAIACGVAACGQSAPTAMPQAPGVKSAMAKTSVLLPVAEDPSITYAVWFAAGSQDDPVGKEGLAWMTGQLLAQGSTERNSYQSIIETLFPMAASYEVRVDREMTTLTGRVHRDHQAAFQALFSEAYLTPKFSAEDIERVRNQGLTYLEKILRYASDEELGKAALNGFIYSDTRYAHPVAGTVAGLKSITAADIRQFYNTHYNREQAVFALGGGYDDTTVAALEATRMALPDGQAQTSATITAPAFSGRHMVLVDKPGADASISFGFPIDLKRGDDDFYPLWVASSWLGEHRNSSSHLYKVIRAKRGLNYGDYAYIEAFPEGGFRQMPPTNVARQQQFFEVWIRTLPNDKALFALRAAIRELRMLVDEGMTPEEFELTRSFLRKYILHFAPTTETRLGYRIDDRFYGIEEGHFERAARALATMTVDDVNRALKKHLQYQDMKIAIVTGEAKGIMEAASAETASPITYPTEKPNEILEEDKKISVEPLNIPAANIRTISVEQMFAQ